MRENKFLCSMLLGGLIVTCCVTQKQEQATPNIRHLTQSRVVKIPVHLLPSDTSRAALRQNPGALTMTPGAEDELPQGPESFDVLDDGGFVIADPLQQRLVFYDSLGTYLAAWPIGVAANSVKLLEDGLLEVRKANSNAFYRLDESGHSRPVPARERSRSGAGVEPRSVGRRACSDAIVAAFSAHKPVEQQAECSRSASKATAPSWPLCKAWEPMLAASRMWRLKSSAAPAISSTSVSSSANTLLMAK